MARTQRTDSGSYNRQGIIQAPASYSDDGQGGNSNANVWNTVRGGGSIAMMVDLESRTFGRGLHRTYQYGQLYPDADHWAAIRYSSDVTIDATMRLVIDNRVFQILGAEDVNLEHVTTLLALTEYRAQGSK